MNDELTLKLSYDWTPLFIGDGRQYSFPERPTAYMTGRYPCPAIYRWNIFEQIPSDLKLVYIGETVCLCPTRLVGYLSPGPSQQTNIRINREFTAYLTRGYHIRLETLSITELTMGEYTLSQSDLADRHFRRMIEHMMVIITKRQGFTVLNA